MTVIDKFRPANRTFGLYPHIRPANRTFGLYPHIRPANRTFGLYPCNPCSGARLGRLCTAYSCAGVRFYGCARCAASTLQNVYNVMVAVFTNLSYDESTRKKCETI